MQGCATDNSKLFGRAVVLEVALGCPDVEPTEAEFKSLAAGTSKGLDFAPNTTTSDADDTAGWVETLTTSSDATVSFEGEVRKNDKLDQFGFGNLVVYYSDEMKAMRQPTLWVRMEVGPIEFVGYMVISNLTPADGGTNDIVTFSVEFKVSDASTVKVTKVEPDVAVTGVTVTPTSGNVAVGATTTFAVNIAPTDATDKTYTVTSSAPTKATATLSGSTVTVTGVATGTANIVVTTTDGSKTATFAATVTA